MSLATVLLAAAEAGHTELPIPTWLYGVIALVAFLVLALVIWSFKDVSNRHALRADSYAASHGGAPGHTGH
jgi:protein-S-isoprenylcysteine O-methyltransferase Ste14